MMIFIEAKTPTKEVYNLIVEDAKLAKSLLNGSAGLGFPKAHAAQMLLAKVYMLLATNPELQDDGLSEMDYWNLAYTEAKDIYMSGEYSLVADYASLFDGTNENSESQFLNFRIVKMQEFTNGSKLYTLEI